MISKRIRGDLSDQAFEMSYEEVQHYVWGYVRHTFGFQFIPIANVRSEVANHAFVA